MEIPGFLNVSALLRSGIYALIWKGKVVYVGKSKYMLRRIYEHRVNKKRSAYMGRWTPVKSINFDDVWVLPCSLEKLDVLEREFINLYKPRYNVFLKTPDMITQEIVLRHGDIEIVLNRPRQPMPTVIVERRL